MAVPDEAGLAVPENVRGVGHLDPTGGKMQVARVVARHVWVFFIFAPGRCLVGKCERADVCIVTMQCHVL